MNISLNWLKEFVDFEYSPAELDQILTMLGIEVEGVIDYKSKYDKFVIAKVIEHSKHPDADKLSICKVSDGDNEYQVVCGAPNVGAGQTIVFGKLGAIVPSAGFKLEKRKIRGIESQGMICSQQELELGEDHDGIWVLPENAPVGTPLVDYVNMNDIVFEISVTPNKSDCLSHLGIAREIAAYMGKKLKPREIVLNEGSVSINDEVKVIVEDAEKCPRYTARVIKNVKMQESPIWLQNRLRLIGLRPINVAVDVTNYILMESGQPMHAFDLDELADKTIIVKTAQDEQKFTTLDSKERTLDSSMLLINDGNKAVAVGGVMGGENSEIKNNTTNILLESAFFNPSSVRKTAKKLNLSTDSSYRFERGVDIDNVPLVLDKAAKMIAEICGGEILKGKIDVYPKPQKKKNISLRYAKANSIIGINLNSETIISYLERFEFKAKEKYAEYAVFTVPSHRVDVDFEIDLIEEVARLYNYDNIELNYTSSIDFQKSEVADHLKMNPFRSKIRHYLVDRGYNEILTQNQIDPKSSQFITDNPVVLSNPLGEDLSIMRSGLIPSILKVINHNIRNGNTDLTLFEIGKTFMNSQDDKTYVKGIAENEELIIAITGKSSPKQWGLGERKVDFYDIKGIAEELLEFLKVDNFKFQIEENPGAAYSSNTLKINVKNLEIGKISEIKNDMLKNYDIDNKVFVFTLNLSTLLNVKVKAWKYDAVSPYPAIERDLAFIVDSNIKTGEILDDAKSNSGNLMKTINLFDIYEGKNIGDGKKSIAFSIVYQANDRTLVDKDVDESLNKIIKSIESKFGAVLRKS